MERNVREIMMQSINSFQRLPLTRCPLRVCLVLERATKRRGIVFYAPKTVFKRNKNVNI